MMNVVSKPICLSTHGGAGYAPGSYWKGTSIVCGVCAEEIKDPPPTGGKIVYSGLLGKFLLVGGTAVPTWPDWIDGEPFL